MADFALNVSDREYNDAKALILKDISNWGEDHPVDATAVNYGDVTAASLGITLKTPESTFTGSKNILSVFTDASSEDDLSFTILPADITSLGVEYLPDGIYAVVYEIQFDVLTTISETFTMLLQGYSLKTLNPEYINICDQFLFSNIYDDWEKLLEVLYKDSMWVANQKGSYINKEQRILTRVKHLNRLLNINQ